MKKIKQIIPGQMYLPLALTLLCNAAAYNGTRFLTRTRFHYDLTNRLDEMIPFVPWTVAIYFGCYLFWIINYIIGCRQEKEKAFAFLSADLFAKLICMFCFILFPTTNQRPVVEGQTFWEEGIRLLYRLDAADNLFPSIHCLTSTFCVIAVWRNPKIPFWYQMASVLIAVSIYISTLTTRQHVVIDVLAGIILAYAGSWFVKKSGFAVWYENAVTLINQKIKEAIK